VPEDAEAVLIMAWRIARESADLIAGIASLEAPENWHGLKPGGTFVMH
jgi:hypothetical protein